MVYLAILAAVGSYLLGNLNGSVIASSLIAHDDVRSHGSGNAGLTNFIRSYGVQSALLVVLIDAGKAILACLISGLLLASYGFYLEGTVLGGVFVLIGHDFPILLGFRGGKGILSGLFIALMVDWRIALIITAVFFAAYLLTQYVSLGSILAALAFSASFAVFCSNSSKLLFIGVIVPTDNNFTTTFFNVPLFIYKQCVFLILTENIILTPPINITSPTFNSLAPITLTSLTYTPHLELLSTIHILFSTYLMQALSGSSAA